MKIRRSILLLCGLAIILTMVFALKSPKKESEQKQLQAENVTETRAEKVVTNTKNSQTPSAEEPIPQPSQKTTVEEMREGLAAFNDAPIAFYGKIQDQFGNPVNGAEITGSVMIRNGVTQGTTRISVLISDANGLFTISGYKGERLSFTPKKVGYALASLNCGGIYSTMYPEEQRVHPDPKNPIVIKMWKLQGAEPLVSVAQRYKLHYTNTPLCFDLLTGKIVPSGGDIKVTVSRSPGIISERSMQDWSVQVEAVDGGLMDSSGQEVVTYWAPENGYQSSETFIFSTNVPYKWSGGFNNGFFVKSRNGQVYSKMGFSFGINQKPEELMYVILGGIANPNGSRNWEGDSSTIPHGQ